jgi:hypothetical protein
MKNLMIGALLAIVCAQGAYAQKTTDSGSLREARDAARQDISLLKKQPVVLAAPTPAPNPFNDMDSFGKNALFLGSLYAGTVYVYKSCDPADLLNDLGVVLAADDHCLVKPVGGSSATQTVTDSVWEITIPGKTVNNVIYPMLNNGVGWENDGITSGGAGFFYSPRVTIVSDALNDPAAIDPTTGLPMNGSYTVGLAGSEARNIVIAPGDSASAFTNNASIAGRGLSRSYFRAIGLPEPVINKLFKKDMTLKFGIRVNVFGAIDFAQFFYTFRILGN